MLFNSYIFIFIFLPVTLVGFHLIGKRGHHRIAISWLVGASLFFYAWWNPAYLGLMLISILFNYAVGVSLLDRPKRAILFFGVIINFCLLGYFKYANFFVDSLNVVTSSNIVLEKITLPIAISFFTFQQITYLVDAYRGETKEYNFLHYCLFVTFFPQLIAGPIVHHKEMLPQFAKDTLYKLKAEHFVVGMTIFLIGLFKKCILADGIAVHATPVFAAAELGMQVTFFEAWGGALAYTFQLYFDFSGYSEMALGLARMFGVRLPVNFLSPYKANNIIDFWKRWHITLSRFLRDYLYISLGGNRKGPTKRYLNLMITMLLGGLWHGAGWTFLVWGGLHGFYLIINHGWHAIKQRLLGDRVARVTILGGMVARMVTFIAIVVAWVVFRADSMHGALKVYEGMLGLNGFSLPVQLAGLVTVLQTTFPNIDISANGLGAFGSPNGVLMILGLLLLVWFAPNTIECMQRQKPALGLENLGVKPLKRSWMEWKPITSWAIVTAGIAVLSIISLTQVSEFLYFQF